MSGAKLRKEAERWYKQSEDDIGAASGLLSIGKYAQSCFYAQQAAEKSLKAVGFLLDTDPWGHSCTKLIQSLPSSERKLFAAVEDNAKSLDKLYIPTRYPDALADITPAEAFTEKEAHSAIELAQEILSCVESRIYRVPVNSKETIDEAPEAER